MKDVHFEEVDICFRHGRIFSVFSPAEVSVRFFFKSDTHNLPFFLCTVTSRDYSMFLANYKIIS